MTSFEKELVDINDFRQKKGAKGTFSVMTLGVVDGKNVHLDGEYLGTYSNSSDMLMKINEVIETLRKDRVVLEDNDFDYTKQFYALTLSYYFGDGETNFSTIFRIYTRNAEEGKEIIERSRIF
jgi:hypothetical protein